MNIIQHIYRLDTVEKNKTSLLFPMAKRKASFDGRFTPILRSPFHADHPTRRQRKCLFRNKNHNNKPIWAPRPEPTMTALLDYILQHEDAFQNPHRINSLFSDFRHQREINPEGYNANITAWTKALSHAARAGVIPTQGTTCDVLCIRTGDELLRSLAHPVYGKPEGLSAAVHEAVRRGEMMPLKDFIGAKESIYKTSWLPSAWTVMQWSLRQVGVLGQPGAPNKLAKDNFVVVKNVEVAADEIIKKMKEQITTADRVLSRADFLKRFQTILNPAAPLTISDLNILLVHMARDKQAISYNVNTIKFKPELEATPTPITQEDEAIVGLRDTLANIHAQIQPLMEKIKLANAAAKEAVAAKQMVRAKAALRSKKLAETALQQRSDVALQLEGVYQQLQQAADQVEIVEAMRAGADALKTLNEKVGGAEGVQGVVDAVNEQMMTTDEITTIINESEQPLDEGEIDDEFEALEKAEKEKQAKIEAEKTAARLAELEQLETLCREKEQKAIGQREQLEARQRFEQMQREKRKENEIQEAEEAVQDASQSFSQLTVDPADEEMKDRENERVMLPA